MTYEIREKACKYFHIDLGLRPGYDERQESFSVEDIKVWYAQWQQTRAENNEPVFAGVVMETSFVYPHESKGIVEHAARIEGEIVQKYHGSIYSNNEEILKIICNLAKFVGSKSQQERVHLVFENKSYVLEKQ